MKNICPVCGFDELEEPPYSPGGVGSEDICESCGFQFETLMEDEEDGSLFNKWRAQWISGGMKWYIKNIKQPDDWDPKRQLLNIGIKL